MTAGEVHRRPSLSHMECALRLVLVTCLCLLMLTVQLGVCLSPSHPRYSTLVRCRDDFRPTWSRGGASADKSMAACLKELILAVGPRFKSGRGIRTLGIEKNEPLSIPLIPLDIPELSMTGNATNVLFQGGWDSTLSSDSVQVEASTGSRRAKIVMRTPSLVGTGDFQISINFLRVLFPGADLGTGPIIKGRIEGSFDDVVTEIFLILGKPSATSATKGLAVTNVGMKQKFGGVRLKMVPVFTGAENAREREQQEALSELNPWRIQAYIHSDFEVIFPPSRASIVPPFVPSTGIQTPLTGIVADCLGRDYTSTPEVIPSREVTSYD